VRGVELRSKNKADTIVLEEKGVYFLKINKKPMI